MLFKTRHFDNRGNLFYNFIIKYPPKERDPLEVKRPSCYISQFIEFCIVYFYMTHHHAVLTLKITLINYVIKYYLYIQC